LGSRIHGTTTEYRHGCRCICCRGAHTLAAKKYLSDPEHHAKQRAGGRRRWGENAEEINAERRSRYANDPDYRRGIKAQNARYYDAHRTRVMEKVRRWAEEHPERIKARQRNYYQDNRERILRMNKEWAERNPERARELSREASHRRRAKLAGSGGSHTPEDVTAQFNRQQGKCFWCGRKMRGKRGLRTWHADHIVPVSLGGSDNRENIVCAHWDCNISKGGTHPMDFAGVMF